MGALERHKGVNRETGGVFLSIGTIGLALATGEALRHGIDLNVAEAGIASLTALAVGAIALRKSVSDGQQTSFEAQPPALAPAEELVYFSELPAATSDTGSQQIE